MKEVSEADDADKTQIRSRALPAGALPSGAPAGATDSVGATGVAGASAAASAPAAAGASIAGGAPVAAGASAAAGASGAAGVSGAARTFGASRPRGTTGSTGSSWSDPGGWANSESAPLGTGSVINGRFVLEQVIGRGGMGTVYRARDIRKEEAQDRNPYVAIKVLNEDFKRHPESLRALQRESRKAQKLAHPNIVTVYDFDRDGANVYMVMELLEGEPLDRHIKRTEGLGLGVKETIRIMRGICRAMDYAHEQGVVHADFKPANAFLTRSNVAKVFDFGIARAVKRSDQLEVSGEAAGDMTLFDPGTLGALTPAYAGCEVIEGLDPDPRDDVYAIACVAYELITGRHPFNGLSAAQAEKAGLTPKQPEGVSARQWRSLRRGLSVRREGRPRSAMDLFEGIRPLRRSPAMYATAAAAAVIGLALATTLVSSGIDKLREHSAVAALASGDAHRIEPMLAAFEALDSTQRGTLLLHDDARAGLIEYFEGRINALVDESKGRYDYPRAEQLMQQLEGFIPDSQVVRDVRDRLTERKNQAIKRESDAFDQDLQRGWLIAAQNRDNIGTVLAIVRQIDPKSLLLSDPRLPGAFAERARQALEHKDPAAADTLVTTGLAFAPQDAALTDLKDQTERALSAQKLAARQSNLEQSIRALAGSPDVLAASEAQNKDIESLRAIDPNDPALSDLRQQVQNALDTQLAGELRERQFDQGLALLARYADLTAPDYVDRQRQELLTAQSRAAEQPKLPAAATAVARESVATASTEQHEGTQMQLQAELTAGLEQSTMTLAQAKSLAAAVDELTVRRDPNATALKRKLANHLAQIAGVIKTKEGNEAATTFTKGAYALFPESAALKKTLINLLVVAAQHDSAQRAASIVTLKNNIEALLVRPNLDTAWDNAFRRELRKLTVYVSESDPYVNEVKARVSWIYVTQAGKLRSAQRLTEAARMLERSRDYEAQSAERTVEEALLADARTREELGEKDLDRAAYLSSLKQKLIIQAQANDVTGAETSLRVLHESLPADDRFMTQDAPLAIAQADARMAWGALKDGQFKSAVELINRSRLVAPFSEFVSATQARYLRYAALDEYLTESPLIDVRKVRAEIGTLSAQDSNTTKVVVPLLSHHLAARMHAATDTEVASRLQHVGREIFLGDAQFKNP